MASEWDTGRVMAVPMQLNVADDRRGDDEANTLSTNDALRIAREFVRSFQRDGVFVYREALRQNVQSGNYALEIDLSDLAAMNKALSDALIAKPSEYCPLVERGIMDALLSIIGEEAAHGMPGIQLLLCGNLTPTPLRDVAAAAMNHIVLVPGIVIDASRTRPRATDIVIKCRNCGDEKTLHLQPGFGSVALPSHCENLKGSSENGGNPPAADSKCPPNPFVILTEKSTFVDTQTLKLQEPPESVPTGEMPRHIMLSVERSLADKVAPGTRVSVLGVAAVFSAKSGRAGGKGGRGALPDHVRTPYLRAVGFQVHDEGTGRASARFTPEEEAELRTLARDGNAYQRLADSIAPSINGDYTDDIKKAILCLLLSGSRKLLPDGMRLRGDINVLLMGDPSTAKSQFLKFVEKVAPVAYYTSGKGSSAAGLTASVIRDAGGEFHLAGGAMVLADGGVCCIDEFDKMRDEDRVAIHEAMEQQTISVAKAGITTILNSRSAVLAAANPVYGRYDDTKTAADNITLQPTILSRFDMIFIVRDLRDQKRDEAIAKWVVQVNVNAGLSEAGLAFGGRAGTDKRSLEIDMTTLKKYIAFARAKCAPRLTVEAAKALQAAYVDIRQGARATESSAREAKLATSEEHGVIPITVRQLEALIRMTEAVAKASLQTEATVEHVTEAIRLFRVSTLNAAASGLSSLETGMDNATRDRVRLVEDRIGRMLPVGGTAPTGRVREQLGRAGFTESEISAAIKIMERRDEVSLVNERRTLRRQK